MMNKKNFLPTLYPLSRDLSKTWFVKFYSGPGKPLKRYGQLNHIPTLKERLKEAERIIKQITDPVQVHKKQRTDLLTHLSAILEYKRPELALKSYQTYFSYLNKFAAWYRPAAAHDKAVSPGEYIRHMHLEGFHSNYTRKNKVFLSSFFKILVKRHLYPLNPFEDIRVKKVKGQSLLPFHLNQVATLKKMILENDPQLWEAVLFQYYLFFRPHEIRQLRVGNILFDEMQIEAGSDITKDDDEVRKAIPLPMRPVIDKYRGLPPNWFIFSYDGKPGPEMIGKNYLTRRHRKYLDELGLSDRYGFYSWVHTGCRVAAMNGIPMKQLQLQKGHSDLKMFDEYLKKIGVGDCVQLINDFPAI